MPEAEIFHLDEYSPFTNIYASPPPPHHHQKCIELKAIIVMTENQNASFMSDPHNFCVFKLFITF